MQKARIRLQNDKGEFEDKFNPFDL